MKCIGFQNKKEEELEGIVTDAAYSKKEYTFDRINALIQEAFTAGAEAMVSAPKAKTTTEASRKLQALSRDIFLINHRDFYTKYFYDMIDSHTGIDGKLPLAFKEEVSGELYTLLKAVYVSGFINGVEVSLDKLVLSLYLKNKQKLVNGQ